MSEEKFLLIGLLIFGILLSMFIGYVIARTNKMPGGWSEPFTTMTVSVQVFIILVIVNLIPVLTLILEMK